MTDRPARFSAMNFSDVSFVFDFDGTLHDLSVIYPPAFEKAREFLIKGGYRRREDPAPSPAVLSRWLGDSPETMWAEYAPDLPVGIRRRCAGIIGEELCRRMRAGEARLYPGTEEVLSELSRRGAKLMLLSNCSEDYLDAAASAFSLDQRFDCLLCTKFLCTKKELLLPHLPSGPCIAVGDRAGDIALGKIPSVLTIACDYGYGSAGELSSADAHIKSIRELFHASSALLFEA